MMSIHKDIQVFHVIKFSSHLLIEATTATLTLSNKHQFHVILLYSIKALLMKSAEVLTTLCVCLWILNR